MATSDQELPELQLELESDEIQLDATAPLLEVTDLHVEFPTDEGLVKAVDGVNFTVDPNEVLGIVGESGSGKTVTSMAVLGLLPKTARITGDVRYRGQSLLSLSERDMRHIRGKKI